MIEFRYVGIVLRSQDFKLSVFDNTYSLCNFSNYTSNFSRGSFISYTLKKQKKNIIQDVKLEYIPLVQARYDIYFLHSLLDICYYFIPEGSVDSSIYLLMEKIVHSFDFFILSHYFQKIIVCIFFARLGVYPLDSKFHEYIKMFIDLPIDNITQWNLDLINEVFIDTWLVWCIQMYPQGKKCKALSLFLQKR